MLFGAGWVAAGEVFFEPAQSSLDKIGAAFESGFAKAGDTSVSGDFQKDQVAPSEGRFMNSEAGDFRLAVRGSGPQRTGSQQAKGGYQDLTA